MTLTKAQEKKAQDLARQIEGNVAIYRMGGYWTSFQTNQRNVWNQVAAAGKKIATRVNEILKAK